jgi:hypothetical protein
MRTGLGSEIKTGRSMWFPSLHGHYSTSSLVRNHLTSRLDMTGHLAITPCGQFGLISEPGQGDLPSSCDSLRYMPWTWTPGVLVGLAPASVAFASQ